MDIGCGMALYDYFLFKHYHFNNSIHLYLVDKTNSDVDNHEFVGGGWHPAGKFSFYTSLECAADILIDNTKLWRNIHKINATKRGLQQLTGGSFDVVYSLLSYGHHYPVHTYLEEVFHLLRSGGTLILDLRRRGKTKDVEGLRDLQIRGFRCTTV
eukprot:5212618-Pyramimonas_sp.AAC.1